MSTKRMLAVILMVGIVTLGAGNGVVRALPGPDVPATPQAVPPDVDGGAPIGSRFVILNDATVSEQSAAVAYNPSRDEYLVVWYNDRSGNDDIRARRVSWDGTPVGSAFYISAGSGADRRYPDVAYNAQRNEYLVVWEHYTSSRGYGVYGRIVSATGVVQGTTDLILASNPSTHTNYLQPSVVYAATSDKYLLVYRYDNGSMLWQTIVAAEYDGDMIAGTSVSPPGWNTSDLPEKPDVAYNRSRDECLVVWQQMTGGSGDADVYGRRVTMGGTSPISVTGSVLAIATSSSSEEVDPAVAAVPTTPDAGKYLVVWEADSDIRMQPVDGDGTQHTARVLAITAWTEHSPSVVGNEARQQFLAVWVWIPVITPPAMMNVYGRPVTLEGTMLGTDAVQVGGGQVFETAVAAGGVGDYLIAFDDNEVPGTSNRGIYGRLWGTRVYLPLALRNSP